MKTLFLNFFILLCVFLHVLPSLDGQSETHETLGDIGQVLLPVIAGGSTLIIESDDKAFLQFIKSFGVSWAGTHIMKRAINKERPNEGNYAFPSGHTAAAFSGASFIHRRYGKTYGIPAYLIAGYVGWSRVQADKHDWWDIAGGAACGILPTYLFVEPLVINEAELSIDLGPGGINMTLVF